MKRKDAQVIHLQLSWKSTYKIYQGLPHSYIVMINEWFVNKHKMNRVTHMA